MTPESANLPVDCEALSEAFLSLHEADGFTRLQPSSLLHDSVPMSFVMSAGLIQVENDLDKIIEETGGTFAFTQPCFRHFDMKQVGEDPTRLSLFHMSAAFHIGNAARKTILPRLWRFLTEVLQLDPGKLWISYLDDPKLGKDTDSYQCWRELGVATKHLIGLDEEHCFWQQRSLGKIASDGRKCGPHTEIFFERTDVNCKGCKKNYQPSACIGRCRKGRFVEISNSLFIENHRDEADKLVNADTPFAECVVGLERLAMILQGVTDVYHTQRFAEQRQQLEAALESCTQLDNVNRYISINTILDHFSAFSKLIEDGAPSPGRGGRRTIMRKLLRTTLTHLWLSNLDIDHLVINEENKKHLSRLLKKESKSFRNTIHKVKRRIHCSEIRSRVKEGETVIDGAPISLITKHCKSEQQYEEVSSPFLKKGKIAQEGN